MKIISWNSRGVNNAPFRREVKEMIRTYKPDIVCFLETKSAFDSSALSFMSRQGFNGQFKVPAEGFASGLWLFWKSPSSNLSVIYFTSQAIHCTMQHKAESFFLTFGYIRPHDSFKDMFWTQLRDWSARHEGAWVVMGDFNDIASMD
ncbi:hypothetical protein SLE2022_313710 [Rubroshorea leprosula]